MIGIAAIVLTWKVGLLLLAAVLMGIVFVFGLRAQTRAWNLEAAAFCLGFIAWALWAAGL